MKEAEGDDEEDATLRAGAGIAGFAAPASRGSERDEDAKAALAARVRQLEMYIVESGLALPSQEGWV